MLWRPAHNDGLVASDLRGKTTAWLAIPLENPFSEAMQLEQWCGVTAGHHRLLCVSKLFELKQ